MLELKGITAAYAPSSPPVLKNFSAVFEPGKVTACLGKSGSGKSTILKTIAGVMPVVSGDATINGEALSGKSHRDKRIGVIFQNAPIYPGQNVLSVLKTPVRRGGRAPNPDYSIESIIDLMDLRGVIESKVEDISGGEKQRAALGRLFTWRPEILLLDEPLSNIDLQRKSEILIALRDFHDKIRAHTLYITHDRNEAFSVADQILIIDDGGVIQTGSPEETIRYPATLDVTDLVSDSRFSEIMGNVAGVEDNNISISIRSFEVKRKLEKRSAVANIRGDIIIAPPPEKAHFVEGDAQHEAPHLRVEGRVDRSLFRGNKYLVSCQTDIGVVRAWSASRIQAETNVKLDIDLSDVCLYSTDGALLGVLR